MEVFTHKVLIVMAPFQTHPGLMVEIIVAPTLGSPLDFQEDVEC